MKCTYMPRAGNRTETADLHWLNIEIDGNARQGRMSETVCNVEVSHPAGKVNLSARFFLAVGIDSNGKPYARVTGLKATSDTSKCVFAGWLDFKARADAKIGGGA